MVTIAYASKNVGSIVRKIASMYDGMVAMKDVNPVDGIHHLLIRWGSLWAGYAESEINTREAILTARDKRKTRRLLEGICPKTWYKRKDIELPCIIRKRRHFAGSNFFVCYNLHDVKSALAKCHRWYASELIDKAKEYRVFVFQDRVIRISEKLKPKDGSVAWNLAVGGGTRGVQRTKWPIQVALIAIEAANRVGLDWSAVDVIVDKQDKSYVLETNTAPGLKKTSVMKQIAKAFLWSSENAAPIPLDTEKELTWKDIIHPSLRKNDL